MRTAATSLNVTCALAALFVFALGPGIAGAQCINASGNIECTQPTPVVFDSAFGGTATPYPSVNSVSGVNSPPSALSVRFTNIRPPVWEGQEFLLVDPLGNSLVLMADISGAASIPGSLVSSLVLSDGAGSALPDVADPVAGSYRPTATTNSTHSFPVAACGSACPEPAPDGVATLTSQFLGGGSLNGDWSLYVVSDNILCDFLNVCGEGQIESWTLIFENVQLPVELVSFEAVVSGSSVNLSWQTASERNNAGFAIEQRVDEEAWMSIAFVEGQGTTDDPRSYSYEVRDVSAGTTVFRLKQIDFDGAFEYSPVVEAAVEMPGRYALEPPYPNPFNPSTTIRFVDANGGDVHVGLYDVTGRQVMDVFDGSVGAGSVNVVQVDGTALPSGLYLVRMDGEGYTATQRVMLLK